MVGQVEEEAFLLGLLSCRGSSVLLCAVEEDPIPDLIDGVLDFPVFVRAFWFVAFFGDPYVRFLFCVLTPSSFGEVLCGCL